MARGRRSASRKEWLIAEWPEGHEQPSDYWISNLPADAEPERLTRLARMRWKMELDYKSSRESWDSTITRAAPGSGGTTTPRWSPPPTGFSPWNAYTL